MGEASALRLCSDPALGRCLTSRGGNRKSIDELVHRVSGMSFDPSKLNKARPIVDDFSDERFPEIAIGHRFALGISPPSGAPTCPPAIFKAVHDIGRVTYDLDFTLN